MSETRSNLTVVDMTQVEVQHRKQYGPGAWIKSPATAEFTGLATRRLTKVSFQAGLGNTRPTKVVLMTGADQSELYLIPVSTHPLALDVRYLNNRAIINLSKFYTQLRRSISVGTREFHPINLATAPVVFEGKEHWALVMPLQHTSSKRIRRTSARAQAAEQTAATSEITATDE